MSQTILANAWKIINVNLDVIGGDRAKPSYGNGLLQMLTMPAWQNAASTKLGVGPATWDKDGKVYKVARTFSPRTVTTPLLAQNSLSYCPTDGLKIEPLYDELEVRYYHVSNPILIDDELMRCIQEGRSDYEASAINQELVNYLDALDKLVAGLIADQRVGTFKRCDCDVAADTTRNLPVFMANGFNLNPTMPAILRRDAMESQLGGPMVLVGYGLLDGYVSAKGIQCCNDLGFDASLMTGRDNIYFDTNVGAALGNENSILAMSMGALQLVTYNKHSGQFANSTEYQTRATYMDMYYGLKHDVVMYMEDCGSEIKRYIQFGIGFDVIGMPDCAFEGDCEKQGIKDVFHYITECADSSFCDMDKPCGEALRKEQAPDGFCDAAEICVAACAASFVSDCGTYRLHNDNNLTLTAAEGFQINGGIVIPLDATYDLTNAGDSALFIADLKSKLGIASGVVLVSGYFDTDHTVLNVFTTTGIVQITIVDATTADVQLVASNANYIHITDTSIPSTDATISTLGWTTGGATVIAPGAPGAAIIGVANVTGDYDEYFTTVAEAGTFVLSIVDSVACTDSFTADQAAC